jgi:hypothetical protein
MSRENNIDAPSPKDIASSFIISTTIVAMTASVLMTSCAPTLSPTEKRRDGMVAFDAGDYVAALELLQESDEADHKDPITHQYLAMCHERLEQFPQAKDEYAWTLRNGETKSERDGAKVALERLKGVSGTAKPRIVLLSSEGSDFSKKFIPTFNRVAAAYKGKVDFIAIDIERPERKELKETYDNYFREKYGETGVPSFVSECREGTIVDSTLGAIEEDEFRQKLDDLVKCPN